MNLIIFIYTKANCRISVLDEFLFIINLGKTISDDHCWLGCKCFTYILIFWCVRVCKWEKKLKGGNGTVEGWKNWLWNRKTKSLVGGYVTVLW